MAKTPKLGQRLCPKCKEIIQADALICKHCGTTFSQEEVAAATANAKKSKRNLGIGCLGLVLLVGFCSYMIDPEKKDAGDKQDATAATPAAKETEKSLGYAPAVFADRFNALASKADKPWQITDPRVEGDSFKHMFNDHIGLVGHTAENGNVSGLIVIGTGDGTVASGIDVFMTMSMVYCAATGTNDLKKCGGPVLALTQSFKEGGKASETVVNNIRFTYQRSSMTGSLFSVDAM